MATLTYTRIEDIPKIHATAREAFASGRTKSIAFRKAQIAQVGYLLKDNEQRIKDALKSDLGRPYLETELLDFAAVYGEVRMVYDKIDQWVKPQRIDFHFNWFPMGPKLVAEPKGVILNIAPFNVPVFLLLSPLVSAIAAGNGAVLKPSEQTPAFSQLIAELLPKYLDRELYAVINGGVAETTKMLELPWDHILYTGNGRIGRIIAAAAAKHLTPTTLELGGQNPVVVDPKMDVHLTAKRLLWGRFSNAGQICLAPEYVLVPAHFQDTLIEEMKKVYNTFYPDGPENSDSFARVVTTAHTQRIKKRLDETKGKIVLGGATDVEKRYIAPTVVRDVPVDDSLLTEEIFGPVLPIVPVKDVDEAISIIRSKDYPLAVYVFSNDPKFEEKVFSNTKSGAAVTNETVITAGVPGLPVGGIGPSGYGYYTGKHCFEQFTHWRVSLKNPGWVDKVAFGFRYPPYKPDYKKYVKGITSSLPPRPGTQSGTAKRWAFWLLFALVGAGSVVLTRSRGQLKA
ncbi:aldehyde dehydrogenase [Polyporus arcularius HHB13444]|uniref:Aldehyde dehydrogenase n=1 Tax=Polyporus arcularius HHB13444 TaxID=1314778 RepID=A0A5C3PG33_9APHY|nr:aldehyde dehydrogenase [Polyporus arcularius HHB13444]